MSTVVETSRLLQYGFFDCARMCCCGFARKTTFWVNIHIIAKKTAGSYLLLGIMNPLFLQPLNPTVSTRRALYRTFQCRRVFR